MKKILLVGVNAKYIHSNLAIRSLRQFAAPRPVEIIDMTINDSPERNLSALMAADADVYGFSCYIFNIEHVLKLAELVKKSRPTAKILLGGPEVSFDGKMLFEHYDFIDYIICGEGECSFKDFVEMLDTGKSNAEKIPGLITRHSEDQVIQFVPVLDALPFPYTDSDIPALNHRIIYYESMRGCPFRCAYCLSSTVPSVRFRSLVMVFSEMDFFIEHGVKQVKFVDRTFNLNRDRTKQLLCYLAEKDCDTNFHFEIAADLLDDELIAIINHAPKGRFQFEIGIQSTNVSTLSAITRKTDLAQLSRNIRVLLKPDNAHIHVDLIAGLPEEDLDSFKRSFNDAFSLKPHMLQLGFLKLLKGTRLREHYQDFGYAFSSFPPYEVISSRWISAAELRLLKAVETVTDTFYNSGMMRHTFDYLFEIEAVTDWFSFFEDFAAYVKRCGFFQASFSQKQCFEFAASFLAQKHFEKALDHLRIDALLSGKGAMPEALCVDNIPKEMRFYVVKDEMLIEKHFPKLISMMPKERVKQIRLCRLSDQYDSGMKCPAIIACAEQFCIVDLDIYQGLK